MRDTHFTECGIGHETSVCTCDQVAERQWALEAARKFCKDQGYCIDDKVWGDEVAPLADLLLSWSRETELRVRNLGCLKCGGLRFFFRNAPTSWDDDEVVCPDCGTRFQESISPPEQQEFDEMYRRLMILNNSRRDLIAEAERRGRAAGLREAANVAGGWTGPANTIRNAHIVSEVCRYINEQLRKRADALEAEGKGEK